MRLTRISLIATFAILTVVAILACLHGKQATDDESVFRAHATLALDQASVLPPLTMVAPPLFGEAHTAVERRIMADLLRAFHQYCEHAGLLYVFVGGSNIGAALYHSFVPWDDDLDAGMPEDDINALWRRRTELVAHGMTVVSFRTDQSGQYLKVFPSFAPLIPKQTFGWPYLDVFPITFSTNKTSGDLYFSCGSDRDLPLSLLFPRRDVWMQTSSQSALQLWGARQPLRYANSHLGKELRCAVSGGWNHRMEKAIGGSAKVWPCSQADQMYSRVERVIARAQAAADGMGPTMVNISSATTVSSAELAFSLPLALNFLSLDLVALQSSIGEVVTTRSRQTRRKSRALLGSAIHDIRHERKILGPVSRSYQPIKHAPAAPSLNLTFIFGSDSGVEIQTESDWHAEAKRFAGGAWEYVLLRIPLALKMSQRDLACHATTIVTPQMLAFRNEYQAHVFKVQYICCSAARPPPSMLALETMSCTNG